MILSVKTSIPRLRDEYNFFPTLVEHNVTFFLYYREAHTNVDGCHGIDAIVKRFEIKTRMLLDYDRTMDRGDRRSVNTRS